jgi:hypothetical protein
MAPDEMRWTIDAVWRIESARLIGGLVRIVGDVGSAEDLAQESLVAAVDVRPRTGIPEPARSPSHAISDPQKTQNRLAGGISRPHFTQTCMDGRELGSFGDDSARTAT